ncbi:glycoside hydrolase family 2 protein [Galbibacter mesophilus]|uniref:glycoside hydrolase family 2 protein n=1 Tax=Galbibacter mesophilus TaxID=379069 RepID=UPI00191DEC24|nr:glycoside hydrolase family 2 TIM barrel-domain containing protein [Galbibacter mesophilus]MCM5663396.1 hypothetical protein [Galbibacter mesophilus]
MKRITNFTNRNYSKAKLWIGCFLLLITSNLYGQEKTSYQRVYLSGKGADSPKIWSFKVSEGRRSGKWTKINVPSNWEQEGFGNYNYGNDHKDEGKKISKEKGEYKHKFEVPKEWKSKWINLVFEGSMTDTKVTVNGKSAGEIHQGAFYRFKYPISNLLEYGKKNLLEVEVSKHSSNESVNRAEREADFWIFGGIFRPVYLEVLPEHHFERIAIDAKHDATFKARLYLNNPYPNANAIVELFSEEGKKISGNIETISKNDTLITLGGKFNKVNSWNPEKPVRYTAKFSLVNNGQTLYSKEEKIGFRTVELVEKDGIYVNGKKIVMKGVNRHSFRPTTGRALSKKNHLEDVRLMKEMNMNAVRMSHYPPDEAFLDVCDSLGLFVLDELTGWQDAYDTIVGPKLIKEMILKDENHPSVIVWDHGNEGGWNLQNEKWFHKYDYQKRPVIYPWGVRNGIDTRHYPTFNFGVGRLQRGKDVFFPTEFLHGLYDGGHGAGLADYWSNYSKNPRFTGGFLWSFADEAVERTDKDGRLDGAGNQAPDGIFGPYHQKEGSFYTIKKIWSPVQIDPVVLNEYFNGKLMVTNKYIYTNLNECTFGWELCKLNSKSSVEVLHKGTLKGSEAEPNEKVGVNLSLPDDFAESTFLRVTAYGPSKEELYTWSWPIEKPKDVAASFLKGNEEASEVKVKENTSEVMVTVKNLLFSFDKKNGVLKNVVKGNNNEISFSGGPLPVGIENKVENVVWKKDSLDNFQLEISYSNYPKKVVWTVHKNGQLKLVCSPPLLHKDSIDYLGITFNYPEDKVNGVRWMGNGPYRVWKNRLDGAEFGVWEKEYNNTITGSDYENIEYPEFKGYHAEMYWLELDTKESPFRIYTETPGLFFRLYTPEFPEDTPKHMAPDFPSGDISFSYEIPAIGTKFKGPEQLGPGSQKGVLKYHEGDQLNPITLWFDFNFK